LQVHPPLVGGWAVCVRKNRMKSMRVRGFAIRCAEDAPWGLPPDLAGVFRIGFVVFCNRGC